MQRNAEAAFTLVELMIVVAIIGVLAGVAIPKFADMLEKSREGATKGSLGVIRSSVSQYYADQQGVYPLNLNTATSTIGGVGYKAFVPHYIDKVPAVKATAMYTGNAALHRGKGPGTGTNPFAVTTGTHSAPAFAATSSGKGWKYNNSTGHVWVNSRLSDMAGKSYTVYGME
jgi:general secretion pathway protein G